MSFSLILALQLHPQFSPDELDQGVLALFPGRKKCASLLESECEGVRALEASRLSGSAISLQKGWFGSGTGKRLSALGTSHLFLLADGSRGEGLGIPSPQPGCHSRRRQGGLVARRRKRQWYALAGLLVLCISYCASFRCRQAHDVRCPGRYGPVAIYVSGMALGWYLLVTLVWVRIVMLWFLLHLLHYDGLP